jgi:hypothetical protein
VTQRVDQKEAPRRVEALSKNCFWKPLDYFPFLAAFLSAFFIFFAIMISFSGL